MAEKVTLLEVDIDTSKAVKDSQELKRTMEFLKEEMAKVKEASGENSKEYIELSAALKQTTSEYNTNVRLIGKAEAANTAATGSIEQMRLQLAVVSKQWAGLSKEERENTGQGQRLTKQKLELTEALKKEEKATGDTRRNVGNYSEAMQGANNAITQFIPGASRATGAAKALGMAFKVMLGPIGLVIAAITSIIQYFKSSEEGQNRLAKATAVFNVVLGNLSDVVSKVGKAIVDAFTSPKQAISDLKKRLTEIVEFFQNTFGNIIGGVIDKLVANAIKGFNYVGLAWQKLKNIFTDNAEKINEKQEEIAELNDRIAKANDRISQGAKALGQSIRGAWDNAKKGLSGYISEQQREIDIAKRLADQQANLDKQIRENLVLEAQDRLKLEQLKNQVEQRNQLTAEERIKLLDEENEILDRILQRNLDIAQQKYEIQKAQNELSNSTKEDLELEAQLLAEVYNVQATLEGQRREAITKRQEAERQIYAEQKALADQAAKDLQDQLNEQKRLEEEERARKLEQMQLDFENEYAVREGNLFGILELERLALEAQREQEVAFAEKIGADVAKVNSKYAKAQRKLDEAELNAKLALTAGFTQNLAVIFGEQTAIGKAAAVASATISTIQGAVNSYNSLSGIPVVGPVLGAAAAAAALVAGYAQVKEILSVKSGLPGDGGGGSAPSGSSGFSSAAVSAPTQAPTSATVGQGIISREVEDQTSQSVASGVSSALDENPLQPTLVTDQVTQDQTQNTNRNQTATI